MSAWSEFYRPRLGPEYLDYVKRRYEPFIMRIAMAAHLKDRIYEGGCGMGTITRALMDYGVGTEHVLSDIDDDMLNLAMFQCGPDVSAIGGDIRCPMPCKADSVHGHGVLEHFGDEDIRAIIAAQKASGARRIIHYVPGEKYKTPSFGDERLMSVDDWRRICAPDEVFTFNDDHDYALIWRN